ncbi:MAG: hypothetical protein ACXABY_16465, partial [Candidatus Thorarchaeota archaeon]
SLLDSMRNFVCNGYPSVSPPGSVVVALGRKAMQNVGLGPSSVVRHKAPALPRYSYSHDIRLAA